MPWIRKKGSPPCFTGFQSSNLGVMKIQRWFQEHTRNITKLSAEFGTKHCMRHRSEEHMRIYVPLLWITAFGPRCYASRNLLDDECSPRHHWEVRTSLGAGRWRVKPVKHLNNTNGYKVIQLGGVLEIGVPPNGPKLDHFI